jgi:hypothetical protein
MILEEEDFRAALALEIRVGFGPGGLGTSLP